MQDCSFHHLPTRFTLGARAVLRGGILAVETFSDPPCPSLEAVLARFIQEYPELFENPVEYVFTADKDQITVNHQGLPGGFTIPASSCCELAIQELSCAIHWLQDYNVAGAVQRLIDAVIELEVPLSTDLLDVRLEAATVLNTPEGFAIYNGNMILETEEGPRLLLACMPDIPQFPFACWANEQLKSHARRLIAAHLQGSDPKLRLAELLASTQPSAQA